MKHVLRRLTRTPLFTLIILVTLAIGIGANTAIFSVINGILLQPLPYPRPDRLVGIWETAPGLNLKELNASPATYFTFREANHTFEDVGIWQGDSVTITGNGEPERVAAVDVTDGVLPVLGIRPELGRWFSHKDDTHGSPETVILSYGYWQRRFGGDRAVIGRQMHIDGRTQQIIGVLPQRFRFINSKPDLILPLQLERGKTFIGNFSYQAVARLKPGVALSQANADVARMLPVMMSSFPLPPGISRAMFDGARIGPNVRPLKVDVVGDIGKVLWVLMGTIGIVLLIACANVANLLLVRAGAREQEFAIRAALGAGWRRIARELIAESVTLGVLGGVLGLLLAAGAVQLLVRKGPPALPRLEEITVNFPVLLFAFLISIAAGVLFGLIPVFKYAGPRVGLALRQGGRNTSAGRERHRAQSVLVITQVALALVLLIGSGLMIRTFQAIRHVQPGFTSPEQILTLRVYIPPSQVKEDGRVTRMHAEIARKLSEIPGVVSVGLTNSITMDGNNDNDPVFAEDRVYDRGQLPKLRRFKFIGPGYFRTMGNPLIAGRDFTWTDTFNGLDHLIISSNLARELWGSPTAALGKRLRENEKAPWRQVIGVVGDERDNGADQNAPEIVYWPLMVHHFWGQDVMVRREIAYAVRSSRAGSASFLDAIRRQLWSVDPNLPLANVRTVAEIYNRSMMRTSFTLTILAVAAAMASLLGTIGIYGVTSYSVSQRTREIGIRMALGSPRNQVGRMFVRNGLTLSAIGIAVGLAAALLLTRLMTSLLFQVSPIDPLTYAGVSAGLLLAALVASYLPARRASGIDPVDCLRAE